IYQCRKPSITCTRTVSCQTTRVDVASRWRAGRLINYEFCRGIVSIHTVTSHCCLAVIVGHLVNLLGEDGVQDGVDLRAALGIPGVLDTPNRIDGDEDRGGQDADDGDDDKELDERKAFLVSH